MARILLVGLATDGPSNVVMAPRTEDEILDLFGGFRTERLSLSGTASSINLEYEPWNVPTDIIAEQSKQLYRPYFISNTLFFGNYGTTGSVEIDLTYTPFLGKSDLITSFRSFLENASPPYVVRLRGAVASLSKDGWLFLGKNEGAKYNNVLLTYDGSALGVRGLEPEYPTLYYETTDGDVLRQHLNADFTRGLSPIYVAEQGSAHTVATEALSGGVDGSFTASEIQNFFLELTMPDDVSHVLFLTPLSSGVVEEITNYFEQGGQIRPVMFFTPAPDYVAPTLTYLGNASSVIPFRSNMISSVVGTTEITVRGTTRTRYAAEAAMIAMSRVSFDNVTNIGLSAQDFTPKLSGDDLELCFVAGFIPIVERIRVGPSPYKGTTTAREESFQYSNKLVEVWSVCSIIASPYLGSNLSEGRHPEIERQVATRLAGINFLQIERIVATVFEDIHSYSGDAPVDRRPIMVGKALVIEVRVIIFDEVLEIVFRMKSE